MMVGASISDEVDGIRAPTMWLTHQIHHKMAAKRPTMDRINIRAAVRCKRIAYETDPRHTFQVGKISHGKSRFKTPGAPGVGRGTRLSGTKGSWNLCGFSAV